MKHALHERDELWRCEADTRALFAATVPLLVSAVAYLWLYCLAPTPWLLIWDITVFSVVLWFSVVVFRGRRKAAYLRTLIRMLEA